MLPTGDLDLLFDIYAVLLLAKGGDIEARDVHNAWVAWMIRSGGDHESIRPFDDLPKSTQFEDRPFLEAIRRVAQSAGL
jgi:hypothetical protein